ncbi:MAG: type I restriction enzyme HsdR N-terminal domain-containing protein [Polaribacter sp.]|nr:type I restriction enzyme HsdR N-terminal domain-containing protein [Polaribacter sp.]
MESKRRKQIVNQLKKALENWDVEKAIKHSKDETQTRDYLINPFFEILNYNKMDDYSHEYIADTEGKRGRRVDMAIYLGKKNPELLVECKKATAKLTDNNFRQLNEYCVYTTSAKIAILTNGVIYNFYTRKSKDGVLIEKPFFSFDLSDYDSTDLDMLALFNRQSIEIDEIIKEAKEINFINYFDDALYKTLSEPSDELLKVINKNMGGKRLSDSIAEQIKELINSISIKTALDKIVQKEVADSNSGIFTTEEEIKAYNVIKTIMAMSSKFKNSDLERITYKDYKGSFKILIDEKQTKSICSIVIKQNVKYIEINGVRNEISDMSVSSLTKFKKELIGSALELLNY